AGERIVQECAAGLITVRRDADRLAFAAPPLLRSGPLDEADVGQLASALGVPRSSVLAHAWADKGPGWRGRELERAAEALAPAPDPAGMTDARLGAVGRRGPAGAAAGPADGTAGPLYEVRAFTLGGIEDPVTGSLNAGIAQWLLGRGGMP